jgi:stearoyl-CoA desaturase (Delta-9 desaturase)
VPLLDLGDSVVVQIAVSLAVGFAVAQIGTLATTVYLHRALSHRAIALRPPAAMAFRVVIWLSVGIKPREWAAVHRKHHAFSDADGDPHSPKLRGWRSVQLRNPALYRDVARDGVSVVRYARDLPPDRWDRLLFDRAFVGLAIGITSLCLLLGWWQGLLASAFHAVAYLQLNAAINAVGHTFGKRPYDNGGTNLQWLALLTSGEGLHNNHHAAPTSARFSLHRGEVDIGWWVISALRRMRLATIRHDAPKLKHIADAA